MTQFPEHETQLQAAEQSSLPDALPRVKAGEAGLAWATPDGDRADGKAQTDAVQTAPAQMDHTPPDPTQSADQGTPSSLLARLRRGQKAGSGGSAQERAEAALPPQDTLRARLRTAPIDLRLHSETDAPLVAEDRTRLLRQEPRPAGPVHEDDFRQESHLRPDDLQEVRAERTELLRAYLRSRRGRSGEEQAVSMQDFQQSLLTENGWFGRSVWLERHLLAPWSVQAAPRSGAPDGERDQGATGTPGNRTVLLMAPRDRARFGSFVRVSPAGRQVGGAAGREALDAQTRRPEVEEALANARLDVVRAATTRLFADWEQEADDLPPEEMQTEQQARKHSTSPS
ncbi:hypothetical protein ACFFLM_00920 [Deinococcus oregonensis]|uniref:Uncharacterized protein n=1 Tax=Deinococcus oregonensis TaxID=1805970 RepID=A0ABV6AST3_9DEIO